MNKHFRTVSVPLRKKSKSPIIRSPAFAKKFQQGMPSLKAKKIPFHNVYDVQLPKKQVKEEKGLQFWGCIVPQKHNKIRIRQKPGTSLTARTNQTRGQTIFKKYIKRRPSLKLTAHSFFPSKQQVQNSQKYKTIQEFRPHKTQNTHKDTELKQTIENTLQPQREQTFLITQEEISKINTKSIYQMNQRQLKISIQWKKKFLEMFQQKMQSNETKKQGKITKRWENSYNI